MTALLPTTTPAITRTLRLIPAGERLVPKPERPGRNGSGPIPRPLMACYRCQHDARLPETASSCARTWSLGVCLNRAPLSSRRCREINTGVSYPTVTTSTLAADVWPECENLKTPSARWHSFTRAPSPRGDACTPIRSPGAWGIPTPPALASRGSLRAPILENQTVFVGCIDDLMWSEHVAIV